MSKFAELLCEQLEKNQYKTKIVSVNNLSNIFDEILEYKRIGIIDKTFFNERLSWIRKKTSKTFQEFKSAIIVAVPRPLTKAIFSYAGSSKALIIPPTYSGYEQIQEKVENQIKQSLKNQNYSIKKARIPLKVLAVGSGLAKYGRNNICYVDGMGSFLQLVAFFSNIPSNETLQKFKMMELCTSCNLCQKTCPTQAISKKRFLLFAERCLTYHNERDGSYPFPDWINKKWHNSLIGCMYCQDVCPANKKLKICRGIEEYFSEKETKVLLNNPKKEDLSYYTLEKLKRLNLADYLTNLPRNLGVFFE